MYSQFEQTRITQLVSSYGPEDAPRLPLDFGDYLSLLWRFDQCVEQPQRARYYRACAQALADALGLKSHTLYRLVAMTAPGQVYHQLANVPYRGGGRLIDAKDRKAAIAQLARLRQDVLRIGTYQEEWVGSWPGSGILETELRERVFAVLFTALQGQFSNFGRLLLVLDIVLANLLLDADPPAEVTLEQLVAEFDYPDPKNERVRRDFASEG